MITQAELDNWFTYHPPVSPEQAATYVALREAAKTFAEAVVRYTPPSADQTEAVRKVREAVMTANAAIACAKAAP